MNLKRNYTEINPKDIKVSVAKREDAREVASLLISAFYGKISSILKKKEVTFSIPIFENYFAKMFNKPLSNTIVFKYHEEIVGILKVSGKTIPIGKKFQNFSTVKDFLFNRPAIKLLGLNQIIRLIIGIAVISVQANFNHLLYIGLVAVKEKYYGKGIGTFIMKISDKIALYRNFGGSCLLVAEDNMKGINLYKKCGFRMKELDRNLVYYALYNVLGFYLIEKKISPNYKYSFTSLKLIKNILSPFFLALYFIALIFSFRMRKKRFFNPNENNLW